MKAAGLLDSIFLSLVVLGTFFFDTFVLVFIRRSVCPNGLAVVRMDAIGDFVLWLDAAVRIRRHFPKSKITLICNRTWADLAERLPYWNEIIPIDRKRLRRNPFYRLKILLLIRRRGFETVIQPTFSREFRYGDSIVRASAAEHRIGSMGDESNMTPLQKRIADRWYTRLVPASEKPLMEIQRNAEFITAIDRLQAPNRNTVLRHPIAHPPAYLLPRQPFFIVFPGSLSSLRRWPAVRFAGLLTELINTSGLKVLVCGSEEERPLCSLIVNMSGGAALNLAGKTMLPELVEVIRSARFIVSNESAAVHIAAAVGTPSVCILGGGHYGRFVPYGTATDHLTPPIPVIHRMDCYNCNWVCDKIRGDNEAAPCVVNIQTAQVLAAVSQILTAGHQIGHK